MKYFADQQRKIGQQQAYEILFELGFGDAISFDEQGRGGLKLRLTDLQWVAAAAALAAAIECGAQMVERITGEAATVA